MKQLTESEKKKIEEWKEKTHQMKLRNGKEIRFCFSGSFLDMWQQVKNLCGPSSTTKRSGNDVFFFEKYHFWNWTMGDNS